MDRKPRANNRHLMRKIEHPVLRYGWTDHGGLVMTMYQISGTGAIVGVSVTDAKYYKDDALN